MENIEFKRKEDSSYLHQIPVLVEKITQIKDAQIEFKEELKLMRYEIQKLESIRERVSIIERGYMQFEAVVNSIHDHIAAVKEEASDYSLKNETAINDINKFIMNMSSRFSIGIITLFISTLMSVLVFIFTFFFQK